MLLEQDRAVLFTTVPDLLDYLRAAYAPTSAVPCDSLYIAMREVDVLVLDDLGAQQITAWALELWRRAIQWKQRQFQIQPILLIHAVIRDAISRLRTMFTRQTVIVPVKDFQHHTGRYRSQQYGVYWPTDRFLQGNIRREFLISGQHHTH